MKGPFPEAELAPGEVSETLSAEGLAAPLQPQLAPAGLRPPQRGSLDVLVC